MIAGAAVAYFIGYSDLSQHRQVGLSGTGLALIVSTLDLTKLYSFKCPRCGEVYFVGTARRGNLLEAMRHCGLPLNLPDEWT